MKAGRAGFVGHAPTVGITRREPRYKKEEQQARELLLGRLIESVEFTEDSITIRVSGGGTFILRRE